MARWWGVGDRWAGIVHYSTDVLMYSVSSRHLSLARVLCKKEIIQKIGKIGKIGKIFYKTPRCTRSVELYSTV